MSNRTDRAKYPRTLHLPWSPGVSDDDKVLSTLDTWEGSEVVVTEKMDGENTTVYPDGYMHARSIDSGPHPSRDQLSAEIQQWAYDLPPDWRACGENLTATHSVEYAELPSRFLLFSLWDGNTCIDWDTTTEWADLLRLHTPPVLWRGEWSDAHRMREVLAEVWGSTTHESEGYVVRPVGAFTRNEFPVRVGKYVRQGHVTTDRHWMHGPLRENGIARP